MGKAERPRIESSSAERARLQDAMRRVDMVADYLGSSGRREFF